jgi:uroporphyrinogen decarboxylase
VAPPDYRRFVLPALARAAAQARTAGVPVIVFTPGAGTLLGETMRVTGADVAGVDWQTNDPPLLAHRSGRPLCRQGNLDPAALYAPVAEIERRTEAMLRTFADAPYIANLGHGILPDTPPDHARAFVAAVKRAVRTPAATGAVGR